MGKILDFKELMHHNKVKKHKVKPAQFESVTGGVQKRLENNLNHRRSSRLSVFDRLRSIQQCESPAPVPLVTKEEHRRQQLEKWKMEKDKRKKEAAANKKKPFLTGVPRAPLKFVPPPPPPQKVVPSTSGVVTRSQSARIVRQTETKERQAYTHSFAPKNASFHPPSMKNVPKIPVFGAPKVKKGKKSALVLRFEPLMTVKEAKQTRSNKIQNAVETRSRKQIDNKNKVMKHKPVYTTQSSSSSNAESLPKENVVKTKVTRKSMDNKKAKKPDILKPVHSIHSSSSEQEVENSTPSPKPRNTPNRKNRKLPNTPKNSIPKSESSSEERLRSPKSLEDVPMTPKEIAREKWKISPNVTMSRGKDNARRETLMKLKEGLLDEDASNMDNVDHFRKQLASEIKRMSEMCDTWDRISEQTVLPEAIQEHVLGAVGQARLLMSQKLVQFSSLIERCARPEPGTALITPADLHGFWDMVFMQVENVDVRFKKLEEMRSRGWKEEPVIKPKIIKPVIKPAVKPTAKPAGAQSRIKDMITAARKAKKEQSAPQTTTQMENKTFEAGFFTVSSPVRSPAPSTPSSRKPSLLKAVLSNEAKKSASKQNTPFAMLRASVLGKNIECDGIAPLPITPKPQMVLGTPGRSILKNTDTAKKSVKKSSKKSIKIVLFNESDTEINTSTEDKPEPVTDSGVSSMDVEKDIQKENSPKQSKLQRQDALDDHHPIGVMTRRMRKSINKEENTPKNTPRNRAKVLEEVGNVDLVTPKRSSRRRKTEITA